MFTLGRFTKRLKARFFLLRGRRPYCKGYGAYKEMNIEDSIHDQNLDINHLPVGYGRWLDERIVEYPWLLRRVHSSTGVLLDAGSALNFAYILSHEVFRNKKIFVSTLAPERTSFWQRGISYVYEDLRNTCYKDEFFDWIVSLSTVEHIGLDNTLFYTKDRNRKEHDSDSYLKAIGEFRRILKGGGVLYLTVPFGRYENHGWFQVFNAEMVDRVLQAFSPRSYSEVYFTYRSNAWTLSSRKDAKDAAYFDCHMGADHKDGYPAAAGAVACLELLK
jgi:SAM-dependent methyltransferase